MQKVQLYTDQQKDTCSRGAAEARGQSGLGWDLARQWCMPTTPECRLERDSG